MGYFKKGAIAYFVLIFGGAAISEIAVRMLGMVDFPIYAKSDTVGYYLKPGQHGAFLNSNRWYVNKAGFNNDTPFHPTHPYTILAGDSVVYGGNPVDYADRIGTLTQAQTGSNVWVAAVGGWSLENELQYLKQRQAEVSNADTLVIQYDNGDLDGLAPWAGQMVQPIRQPVSAFRYEFLRYALPRIFHIKVASELPPIPSGVSASRGAWRQQFDDLLSYYHGPILIVLYPDQEAVTHPDLWADQTKTIKAFGAGRSDRISFLDVAKLKGWSTDLYRDGIHPNLGGSKLISSAIAEWVKEH